MNHAILFLLATGLIVIQVLIGGARPVDALPGYVFIALAGLGVVALSRKPRMMPRTFCIAAALAFAGYVAVRAALSPVSELARPDLFLSLAALVVYLVCALFLCGTQERLALILILMLAGSLHVALGIVQLINQQNFMVLPWIFRPDYGFRASGLFISPNHLAALLGMLAVLTLSVGCWSRVGLAARAFAVYGFMVCLTGLALTGSRAGYYSTAAGLALFGALSAFLARRFNRPNFFGVVMAIALVLTVAVAGTLVAVVRSDVYEKRLRHVHAPGRMAELLAPAAREQHSLAPWFGTGSGTFLYYGREFRSPVVQSDPEHVHNEYLELWAEYGWIGLALFAMCVGAHLVAAIDGLRRILVQRLKPVTWTASNELAITVGALCALCIGFTQASHDFTFHLPANALVAAFLLALLANPTVESARKTQRGRVAKWMTGATVAASAALLLLAVPRLNGVWLAERARVALRDRDYASALDLARRAVRADPASADACYYLGEAERYLALEASTPAEAAEWRRQAAAAFEQGLKVFPRDVRLLLKLGQTRDDLGESAPAGACFDQALALAPNSGIVHACAGVHWHRLRQFGEAARFYRAAQRLGETEISTAGLRDLEHDVAVARSNDAFSDLLPDAPNAPGRSEAQ